MKPRSSIAIILLFALNSALPARATPPPAPEPVLVPIAVAHAIDSAGYVWRSNVSYLFTGGGTTFVGVGAGSTPVRIDAGGRGSIPIVDDAGLHGLLLYVPVADVGSFFGASRVYSTEAPGLGVVIPFVRRSDLTARKTLNLLSVPLKRATRILVRIYDLSSSGDADATVNVYSSSGDRISTAVVHLGMPRTFPDYQIRPTYGEYAPEVDWTTHDSISIEIVPLTDSALLWAFATATDSSSEVVTAVFPAR